MLLDLGPGRVASILRDPDALTEAISEAHSAYLAYLRSMALTDKARMAIGIG